MPELAKISAALGRIKDHRQVTAWASKRFNTFYLPQFSPSPHGLWLAKVCSQVM